MKIGIVNDTVFAAEALRRIIAGDNKHEVIWVARSGEDALEKSSKLHPDSPNLAEDNDLIEREWVEKAKAIVERTREDPHLQNKEINRFKADYLNKRYKKVIKVNES